MFPLPLLLLLYFLIMGMTFVALIIGLPFTGNAIIFFTGFLFGNVRVMTFVALLSCLPFITVNVIVYFPGFWYVCAVFLAFTIGLLSPKFQDQEVGDSLTNLFHSNKINLSFFLMHGFKVRPLYLSGSL